MFRSKETPPHHWPVTNPAVKEELEKFASGAVRSRITERYDLIPNAGIQRVALTMGLGAERYGENNWKGLPPESPANHAIRHLYLWLSGDRSEDHAAHAAANCLMLAELEAKCPKA